MAGDLTLRNKILELVATGGGGLDLKKLTGWRVETCKNYLTALMAGRGRHGQDEFTTLYKQYGRLVEKRVREKISDFQSHDDVMQEVWLKVWRSLSTYDSEKAEFSTWIYIVTDSVCDTWLRQEVEEQPILIMDSSLMESADEENSLGSWIEEHVSDVQDTPDRQISADQELTRGLSLLSTQERAVWEKVYWQGYNYKVTAEKLGISIQQVGVIVHRVKEKMGVLMLYTGDDAHWFLYRKPHNPWKDWSWQKREHETTQTQWVDRTEELRHLYEIGE